MLADEACPHRFVHGLQGGVHVGLKHLPAGHAWVLLLIRVERIVELLDVSDVVSYQFFPCVVLLVLIGVVLLVKHLLGLGPIVSVFRVEAADAEVVPMLHTAFLRTVHRLGILLLGVHWRAEADEGEQYASLQEALLPLAHQVVLHLHLRRASPSLALYQPEHGAEAVDHQVHVLVAVVGIAHHTLARHVVGVVCLRARLGVLQLARQVAVVKRDLRE